MEVVVGVPEAHIHRPVHGSSRRGLRFICSQGSKLQLLMLITQITWAMAKRNPHIILDTSTSLGPWNRTLEKDILHCSHFHSANVSEYFYYWPEDSANFVHCCQFNGPGRLMDYRYTMYGTHLVTAIYYDLGPINSCFPYWTCGDLIEKYLDVATFYSICEYKDLSRLNSYRFWFLVVLFYGLGATAAPLIASLQLVVCAAIGTRHLYCRYRRTRTHADLDETPLPKLQKFSQIFKEYWDDKAVWTNLCMDWLHLVLLSIIGNGLLEAVGRQDVTTWQSKLFFRYSKLYILMSVVLWFSSLTHQFAMWVAVEKRLTHRMEETEKRKEQDAVSECYAPAPAAAKFIDPLQELKELLDLGLDWKWQPIITQAAILFCVWAFLSYTTGSDVSAVILGFLVQAASPWTLLYSLRVGFKTLPFLIKKVARVDRVRVALWKCCRRKHKRSQKHAQRDETNEQDENGDAEALPTPPPNGAIDVETGRSDHHEFSEENMPVPELSRQVTIRSQNAELKTE